MNETTNKRGQLGFLGAYLVGGVFFIIWAIFLAPWFSRTAQEGVANGTLSGVEAFLFANTNLWILVVLFVYFIAVSFIGRSA